MLIYENFIIRNFFQMLEKNSRWRNLGGFWQNKKFKNHQNATLSSRRLPKIKKEAAEFLCLVFKSPIWKIVRIITTLAI
jgi:hypothetical protein